MDAETFDQGYVFQETAGFYVGIGHLEDFPHLSFGSFDASPGNSIKFAVRPFVTRTTQKALQFTTAERGCYEEGEIRLRFLPPNKFRYSGNNCQVGRRRGSGKREKTPFERSHFR